MQYITMIHSERRLLSWILLILTSVSARGHTRIPGLWTQVLDTGLWTLEFGRWTLDAGLWTLGSGCWTLDAGLWTLGSGCWLWMLGSGWWILLLTGETSFWFCLMSRLCRREYVLTWLVLEFLNEHYMLHYQRAPAEKIAIWVIGLDQKKLSWTARRQPPSIFENF